MLPAVHMEGRLAADPELRFAASGTAVARMRVGANSRKRLEDGSWADDKTCWLDVTAFRRLAEGAAETLRKGDLVVLTGKLQTDEWEQEGQKRSKIVCIAESIGKVATMPTVQREGAPNTERAIQRSQAAATNDPWQQPPPQAPPQGSGGPWSGATGGQSDEPPF